MTVHAQLVSGPIGPDTIDLPGEPSRLRSAAVDLRDLARRLDQAGQQLRAARPVEGPRGRTATAMTRGAGRLAGVLEADSQQLGELADAVESAADALADGQGGVDGLRQRWRQARETFRAAMHDAKNAPHDPADVMHGIDATAGEPHLAQFRQQAGLTFMAGGGGGRHAEAMLVEDGGKVQHAIGAYRREVDGIVDELSTLMQRAKNADKDVEARLPRRAGAAVEAAHGGADGDDSEQAHVSSPGDVQSIGTELHEAAQAVAQATERLEDVRLAIRAGRMLPEDERVGSNDGFKRDWTQHLDAVREGLNASRRAADAAVERLRQIDMDGAADIRQALRDA